SADIPVLVEQPSYFTQTSPEGTIRDGASDVVGFTPPNFAPTATLSADRTSGLAPLAVTFSLGASDPDNSIASWSLDFGDSSAAVSGSGPPPATAQHTYNRAGSFTATLTAVDANGAP